MALLRNSALLLLLSAACLSVISFRLASAIPPTPLQIPRPFVVLHGVGDQCSNGGVESFVSFLRKSSGALGLCVEIGDGAADSWTMRLDKQADLFCETVKHIPALEDGFNLIGLSQGALIGRAYIQWCDGPPVYNLISLGGPHAGVASTPRCGRLSICRLIDNIIKLGVYTSFVQNHVAPTGYVRIPNDLTAYQKGCLFLPRLNNEFPSSRNSTYKERFSSINHLVLIMFTEDTVVVPRETAHFGFYADNSFDTLLAANETALYKEDWIGLRSLQEAGKVDFFRLPGDHLQISRNALEEKVLPYLLTSFEVNNFAE